MHDPFSNSRDPRKALVGHLGTTTIPNRGKTTSEEIMIRHPHQVTIAWRTAFRALALAGAVTLVVTTGCGGGSSANPPADTAPPLKYDVAPTPPADALQVPDAAKDAVVVAVDTMIVNGTDVPPVVIDAGPDASVDRSVTQPDAADVNVAEVGGVDSSTPMAEVGGVDSSTAIDGGGSCPSAAHAWSYPVLALNAIAWDSDGTLLTGASFYNTTTIFGGKSVANKGSEDLLVAKLNPSTGNANWVFTAGDSNDQQFGGLVPVGGTIAVLGDFTGTLDIDPVNHTIPPIINPAKTRIDFLVGLKESDGSGVWSASFDLGGGALVALAANPGKDYFLVCGSAKNDAADLSAVGTPGGGSDVVVAAVKASDGTVIWANLFGGAMDQKCTSAALDDSGNAYFAGTYAGSLDFGGGALTPAPAGAGDGIAWVAKLKGTDGTLLAAKSFGTAGIVAPSALSLDPQGALLMAGQTQSNVTFGTKTLTLSGTADGFVAKFDSSSLTPVWARSLAEQPGKFAGCTGIAADSAGNVTVVGRFQQTLAVGPGSTVLQAATPVAAGTNPGEIFVATLSGASGATLCARNYGDPASVGSAPYGVAVNSRATGTDKDRSAIFGFFTNVINFGGSTTALSGGSSSGGAGFLLEM